MILCPSMPLVHNLRATYFGSGNTLRSRNVSDVVLPGMLDVPAPPARLVADWQRETSLRLGLAPGDIEELPLARARARWPDYRLCVQAVSNWMCTQGLPELLESCDVAL
ncbi:MAG: hypothetical protein HQ446_05420, partial [Polaromonas sp.]|nr:hypothetical protein [Polaromonas sp.]